MLSVTSMEAACSRAEDASRERQERLRVLRGDGRSGRKEVVKQRRRERTHELAGRWQVRQQQRRAGVANETARRRFETTAALEWTVADVLRWLRSVGLTALQEVFDSHDVDGAMLLQLTEADLGNYGIRALGHRKLLMRHVAKLARSAHPAARAAMGGAVGTAASSQGPGPSDSDAKTPATASASPPSFAHWSSIAPLSINVVSGDAGPAANNLADGGFDEGRAKADFQQAVHAWRQGRSGIAIEALGDAQWSNPTLGP